MEELSGTKLTGKQRVVKLIREYSGAILGTVIGGVGGYLYYRLVGCQTGACPITSNPWLTIAWGAAMGYLLGSTFNKKTKKD